MDMNSRNYTGKVNNTATNRHESQFLIPTFSVYINAVILLSKQNSKRNLRLSPKSDGKKLSFAYFRYLSYFVFFFSIYP